MNQGTEKQLSDLLSKYITYLASNINDRFQESLPVVSAFQVFDPLLVPDVGGVGFPDYGEIDVKTMADHFYSESAVKATQLKDEWRKFKYDLTNWQRKVKEELKTKTKTAHGQSIFGTEGTTATSGMQQQKEQAKKKPEVKKRHQSSTGIAPRSLPIEFAPSSSPLPYAVFAPTLFEFDPIKSSSPLD